MPDVLMRRRVIVGVDGSLPSLRALRWAAREAELRHAELHAVIVEWGVGHAPYAPVDPRPASERRAELRRVLSDAVAATIGPRPAVVVHQHVDHGNVAEVLARYARGADLLVLGHREFADSPSIGPTMRGCIGRRAAHVVVVGERDMAAG